MKRVFTAINLPDEVKEELINFRKRYKNLPVRWIKKENLHITLCFLGDIKEEHLSLISSSLKDISKNYSSFDIYLTEIHPGPNKNLARMIWVSGPVTKQLEKIQNDITNAVSNFINRGEAGFKLHITLARALKNNFGKTKKIPWFFDKIDLRFTVESFELMESKLSKEGSEYKILEKFDLKTTT